jgi:hypothetical protein
MTWLGYKIYVFTDDDKLFTIRDTEPEKLLMLLIPGCLGNACEPQKLMIFRALSPGCL